MQRHLLYHIYPIANSGMWQWNVEHLKKYISLFDGKRVCAIVYDKVPGGIPFKDYSTPLTRHLVCPDKARVEIICDPIERVEEELKGLNFKFLHIENDQNCRETKTLIPLMQEVQHDEGYTLWCHAKGVTRAPTHAIKRWPELCYDTYMGYWPLVEELLQHYDVAGSFKKHGRGWHPIDSDSLWHYSGSWFWFKNAVHFKKDWKKFDPFWSGIESYPSLHYENHEAGVIFKEGSVCELALYIDDYWNRVVLPEYVTWKLKNTSYRTHISKSGMLCPAV